MLAKRLRSILALLLNTKYKISQIKGINSKKKNG